MRVRIAVMTALLVVVAAPPALANSHKLRVTLQTNETAAVLSGDTAWVALNWLAAGGDAEQFRVTVAGAPAGVEVTYPENTGSYSSLMADDTLSDAEIDFTALKVKVPYSVTKKVRLTVQLSYLDGGSSVSTNYNLFIPVAVYSGSDLAQVTTDLGSVAAGESAWVGVQYTGIAPSLDDFSVVVTDSAGFGVVYPGDGSSSSLANDASLDDGETDVAMFLIDAGAAAPGLYTLEVTATYTTGSAESLVGTVTLTVTSP